MSWPISSSRYQPGAPNATDLWGDVISQLSLVSGSTNSSLLAAGSPLVIDGSFELGTLGSIGTPSAITSPGWVFQNVNGSVATISNTLSPGPSHGQQYASIALSGSATSPEGKLYAGNSYTTSFSNQIMYCDASQAYALRFDWYLSGFQAGMVLNIIVTWLTAAGTTTNQTVSIWAGTPTTGSWKTSNILLQPPANAVAFTFLFDFKFTGTLSAPQTVYLDNVYTVVRPADSEYALFTNTPAIAGTNPHGSMFVFNSAAAGTVTSTTFTVPQAVYTVGVDISTPPATGLPSALTFTHGLGALAKFRLSVNPGDSIVLTITNNVTPVIANVSYTNAAGTVQSVTCYGGQQSNSGNGGNAISSNINNGTFLSQGSISQGPTALTGGTVNPTITLTY